MKTKTIHQTVTFKAPPMKVYRMLMASKKHQSLSGEKARISTKVGGSFTAWGSHISGKARRENCSGLASDGLVARLLLGCDF